MYVEERMYTLKTGSVPEYLKHYQNDGMKVQLKHLPHWSATTSPRLARST